MRVQTGNPAMERVWILEQHAVFIKGVVFSFVEEGDTYQVVLK